MLDRVVPPDAPPDGALRLHYERETPRYWVYGGSMADPGAPVIATVYYRKRAATRPSALLVVVTEAPPPQVVEGRFMEDA